MYVQCRCWGFDIASVPFPYPPILAPFLGDSSLSRDDRYDGPFNAVYYPALRGFEGTAISLAESIFFTLK